MKKVVILSLAVGAILFGLYGLAGNLAKNAETQSAVAGQPAQESTLTVWQLNQPVTRGQEVKRSHFKVTNMPKSQANELGVNQDMTLDYEQGAVYESSLEAGAVAFADVMVNPEDEQYIDLIIAKERVPYAIQVSPESVIGGVITNGSKVDILALSLPSAFSMDASEASTESKRNMYVTPVLTGVKVLKVDKQLIPGSRNETGTTEVNLILELTRKQVATLTVAKRISEIEVHKSIGEYQKADLHADAGDVLSNFKSVVEYRAESVTIN